MVKNLIAALRADLTTLPWMGEATRKAALAKLDTFDPKIGYPDRWRDYSALAIDRGPYVLNVQRADEFEFQRDLNKIGKPVDRTDWDMTPPDGQRVLQPPDERDRVSRRDPPAALLRRQGGRRRQLRRDGSGHRPRDDARLRRPGPQVRRPGQHERLVDARGRQELRGRARSASRTSTTRTCTRASTSTASSSSARPPRISAVSRIAYRAYLSSLGGKPSPRRSTA